MNLVIVLASLLILIVWCMVSHDTARTFFVSAFGTVLGPVEQLQNTIAHASQWIGSQLLSVCRQNIKTVRRAVGDVFLTTLFMLVIYTASSVMADTIEGIWGTDTSWSSYMSVALVAAISALAALALEIAGVPHFDLAPQLDRKQRLTLMAVVFPTLILGVTVLVLLGIARQELSDMHVEGAIASVEILAPLLLELVAAVLFPFLLSVLHIVLVAGMSFLWLTVTLLNIPVTLLGVSLNALGNALVYMLNFFGQIGNRLGWSIEQRSPPAASARAESSAERDRASQAAPEPLPNSGETTRVQPDSEPQAERIAHHVRASGAAMEPLPDNGAVTSVQAWSETERDAQRRNGEFPALPWDAWDEVEPVSESALDPYGVRNDGVIKSF